MTVSTFDDYEAKRLHLLGDHDEIRDVWRDFRASRPPVQDAGAADTGRDPIRHELGEATARLERAVIEVGVFGDIKRGKSTLLNALLGVEVSSMDVLPETAVPVQVEHSKTGRRSAVVHQVDGTTIEVDPDEAMRMASQQYHEPRADDADPEHRVVRVVQRLDADLVREGVCLIDTPGLSDPSLVDDFESLTLAELERVAAAVMVLLSPPGVAANEVSLFRSLDARRVDKTFVVVNFYSDHWNDESVRQRVEQGVRAAVAEGVGPERAAALKYYPVNAKIAWEARRTGDESAYAASGVEALARDLEHFIVEGALQTMSEHAQRALRRARSMVRERVVDRIDLVTDPGRLAAARDDVAARIAAARKAADAIARTVEREFEALGVRAADLAKEPYERALADLPAVSDRAGLDQLDSQFKVRFEATQSRVSTELATGVAVIVDDARRQLLEVFQKDQGLDNVRNGGLSGGEAVDLTIAVNSDWTPVVIGAAVGAGVGGTLAGGAGIALLWFLGPIGWIVGAGIGALAAAGVFAKLGEKKAVERACSQAKDEIQAGIVKAKRRVVEGMREGGKELAARVSALVEGYIADEKAELAAVEQFVRDDTQRQEARQDAEALLARLDRLEL